MSEKFFTSKQAKWLEYLRGEVRKDYSSCRNYDAVCRTQGKEEILTLMLEMPEEEEK